MHVVLNSSLCLTGISHRFWLGVRIGLSPLMTTRLNCLVYQDLKIGTFLPFTWGLRSYVAYSEDLRILGMDISSDLSWGKYISGIAKSAAMRVGCLSRARKFIPPSALLYLYKTSIRPLIEYCSHIWAGAPDCYLWMLDKVQRSLCYLVGEDLAVSLGHSRAVGIAHLFYRLCLWTLLLRYSKLVPFKIAMRETRQSASAHRYTLRSTFWCTTTHESSFFPRATSVWNSRDNSTPFFACTTLYGIRIDAVKLHTCILSCICRSFNSLIRLITRQSMFSIIRCLGLYPKHLLFLFVFFFFFSSCPSSDRLSTKKHILANFTRTWNLACT